MPEMKKSYQVVVMPYPGRGHINPLLNLCNLISTRSGHGNLTITVVVTEEWLELIGSYPKPDNVRFVTVSNIIPSEMYRGMDDVGFSAAVQNKLAAPFSQLLDCMEQKHEQPVSLIVADVTLTWTLDVANGRDIPVVAYWPMSGNMFSIGYHLDVLQKHEDVYVDLSGKGEETIDYIPGLYPIKVTNFRELARELHYILPDLVSVTKKAQSLLVATVYELEPEAVDALKDKFQIPVYAIGLNIPNFQLEPTRTLNEPSYISWLDSKPSGSVLYISMGSYLSLSSSQTEELLAGLRDSGVNFLWAARGEASQLNVGCGSNGLVVEWCDQLKVLLHSAVGGFLSHCGWNSIKESVFAGVPMLTFPICGEQVISSKVIVQDWKIGWEMKTAGMVKREEIVTVVTRFMDSESVERKEMMERVKKLEDVCRESVVEEGSATRDIDCFITANLASP